MAWSTLPELVEIPVGPIGHTGDVHLEYPAAGLHLTTQENTGGHAAFLYQLPHPPFVDRAEQEQHSKEVQSSLFGS